MTGSVAARAGLPLAQPRARRILVLTRVEIRERLRNGEQILLLVLLPLAVLWGSRSLPGLELLGPQAALTTAVVASAFASVAIATGFERRYGVMRAMAATPADRFDITAAKTATSIVIAVLQVLVITLVAPTTNAQLDFAMTPVAVGLAVVALTPWAFLIGMTLRAERVLVVANLIFLGSVASLMWTDAPEFIPSVAVLAMMTSPSSSAALALGLWGLLGVAAAMRFSRWGE